MRGSTGRKVSPDSAYGGMKPFTSNEVRVINRRWASGDKSVSVMKQMIDEVYTKEQQENCTRYLVGD